MIALCAEHHSMADAGAFTQEQLRQFKEAGARRAEEVRGRFEWMRRDVLWVVGGNFYYETPVIFQFRDEPVVWFKRDEDGYLLLNLKMLTTSSEERATIEDNFWIGQGPIDDLESPPHGRILEVRYMEARWNTRWRPPARLAALRVPEIRALAAEPPKVPTLAEAAARWQVSRLDVREADGHSTPDSLEPRPSGAGLAARWRDREGGRSIRKSVTAGACDGARLGRGRAEPRPRPRKGQVPD
jgi:hypothetical protein